MGTSRFTKATKTRGVLGQDTQSGEASPNISTLLVARDSPGHVRDMSRGDLGESLAQLDPYPLCSVVVKFAESQEFLFHPREFALYASGPGFEAPAVPVYECAGLRAIATQIMPNTRHCYRHNAP